MKIAASPSESSWKASLFHLSLVAGLLWIISFVPVAVPAARADEMVKKPMVDQKKALPTWQQITGLLGVHVEHPLVRGFREQFRLRKDTKFDSGVISPDGMAFSMLYEGDCIDYISFRVYRYDNSLDAFDGELPFGIAKDASAELLIQRFGKPTSDSRGPTSRSITWTNALPETELHVSFDQKRCLSEITLRLHHETPTPPGKEVTVPEDLIGKIRAQLPAGWQMKLPGQEMGVGKEVLGAVDKNAVEIFRTQPVMVQTWVVNGPPGGYPAEKQVYRLTLEFGPPMSRQEYTRQVEQIDRISKQITATKAEWKAAPADKDFTHLPRLGDPQRKQLTAIYDLEQSLINLKHSLPEYDAGTRSLRITDWFNFGPFSGSVPVDKRAGNECASVKSRITSLFERYK